MPQNGATLWIVWKRSLRRIENHNLLAILSIIVCQTSSVKNLQEGLIMHRAIVVLAIFVLALSGTVARNHVSAGFTPATDAATLEKELCDADLDFARQTVAHRLEGWMEFFADDASNIHDGVTVTGKTALRAWYEPIFANKDFTLTWTPTHAEAAKDGTLGYTYGNYEARNGAAVSHGMYVTIWRRVNSRWKVVLDLGSAAQHR
jgi:ketosteroid isomerase-like protein